MGNTYTKAFTISSYDLNPKGRARLTTIAHFFQEMAYHHANQLGFGYADMLENQTFWVLSRMRIRIHQYPAWDEKINVVTWHRGMDRLFGLRDFRVTGSAGELMGVASSAWLILDSRSRRPVRPTENVLHDSMGTDAVFGEKLDKIRIPGPVEEMTLRRVVYSDLDIMGHVNNVKYIEWCIDALMEGQAIQKEFREFEINYMQEAMPGDEIRLSGCAGSAEAPHNGYHFVATRVRDQQEIFRARLEWDQKGS